MGAYLSSPICNKDTIEGSNDRLAFAASSMQGWRMSQEDAHNAILNFDDNTSLFAVYDGHGGAEIAVYCSRYLPEFLKKLSSYQDGRLTEALIEGFLKFDSVLLDPNVKKILQKIAYDENEDADQKPHEFVTSLNPNEENHHNDELNVEEAQLLKKEAEVPIEELLKRYNSDEKHCHSSDITKQTSETKDQPVVEEIENNTISTTKSDTNEETKSDDDVVVDKSTATEAKPSSSESKLPARRPRKPVSTDSAIPSTTTIQSDSLTRHLLGDNTDELDDDEDDFEFDASDEETSGDEAEDHETDEENAESGEGDEDEDENKPMEPNKAAQIQKLMRKSIMAILNQRTKKKKSAGDDVKENQNEDNESDDNDDEEENDDDEEIDDEDESNLDMLEMDNDPGSSSGCTAVLTLLRDKQLFVANAGDSRCVVCRGGQAIEMSFDHKPEDPPERSRIEKAGYKVTLDGRVSGGLNLSRAIGDHAYKKTASLPAEKQAITALPDIRTLTLEDQDDFMIIACDGIWNFMSSQDAVDFVRLRLEKKTLTQICEELFMHCLAPNTCGDGTGCDNMTAIIVKFNFNKQPLVLSSPKSINNKRPLSPDHTSTTDTIDNSNNKKMKILTENGTHETNSTEQTSS
ncbi:unnamed protein product [Adineta steineri]|uniref:protein-serine/threonine phosphatase n=1 Tax=Adineta steineri TaxID=433720 RepID=A0A814MQI8_9BILA|nr:unnamed protein product [Adineta steineri]CAF3693727.1 unnamed protein product [Adineta steineri]